MYRSLWGDWSWLMRIDSFFISFITLVLSLLVLVFNSHPLLTDIAYVSALLSVALFTIDDWLDLVFMKLARFLFDKHPCQKNNRRLVIMRQNRSLKARQRWSPTGPANRLQRISQGRRT